MGKTLRSSLGLLTALMMPLAASPAGEVVRRIQTFEVGPILDGPTLSTWLPPPLPALRGMGFSGNDPDRSGEDGAIRFISESWGRYGSQELGELLDASNLIDSIHALIDEDSWGNARNQLTIQDGRFFIQQTPATLDRIGRFLGALESRSNRRIWIDLALVPPAALDQAVPGWSRPGAGAILEGAAFDRIVAAAAAEAAVFSLPARFGSWERQAPRTLSSHVLDHEVNCTGVIPMTSLSVSLVQEGPFAEVLVLDGPSGRWARVDLRLGRTTLAGRPGRLRLAAGEVELPSVREEHLALSVLAPKGRTLILGTFRGPPAAKDGAPGPRPAEFACLLRMEAAAADPAAPAEGLPVFLEAGTLLHPLRDFGLPPTPSGWMWGHPGTGPLNTGAAAPGLLDPDRVLNAVRLAVPEARREKARIERLGGTILVGAGAAEEGALRDALERTALGRARLYQVDLWQGDLEGPDLAALGRAGVVLEEAWIDRMARDPGLRARLLCLGGVQVSLASTLGRSYLADLEKISGGTGRRIITVADPIFLRSGEGLLLTLQADPVPGVPWVQLRLRGECARPPSFTRKGRVRADQEVEMRALPGKAPELKPLGEWIDLDLPDEDMDRWEHLVTAPLGKPLFLNALPDRDHPGRSRALLGVVHAVSLEEAAAGGKVGSEGQIRGCLCCRIPSSVLLTVNCRL